MFERLLTLDFARSILITLNSKLLYILKDPFSSDLSGSKEDLISLRIGAG